MATEQADVDTSADVTTRAEAEIEIRNVTKTFNQGAIIAAEDVSLDIAADEFVVFLGPSGCGKTTTLRCISGLETPDEGSVYIQGEDVTYKKPRERDLAFVFQSIALFPHMTVRENIRFGLDMKTDLSGDEKNERVNDVAEMLGIGEVLDRKPSALSGGQQQRVSLGRAMVMEPTAFLLDEPFSALDAQLRDQMRTEVKRLQRELDTAMVFVTHDQEEAMTLGDKIVVMDSGVIQQIGSPYEIYNDPANLFVANFIGSPSVNTLSCTVERDGADLLIRTDLFDLTIADTEVDPVRSDDEFTIAVRPEYLEIAPERSLFEAEVELVEPHGDRDAIFLRSGEVKLASVVDQGEVRREVDRIGIDIDPSEVWLFDANGNRVV